MNTPEEIKSVVKNKYSEIAKDSGNSECCGPACGCSSTSEDYTVFQDDYSHLKGYVAEADLGLGCGLPTEYAGIKKGDTVVDLGSGAGNDAFVVRAIIGDEGKVVGIDFTEEMLKKADKNKEKSGYENIEFKFGDIENIPLKNNFADVVISNCVLNLVPDKKRAFSEIFRILKPGGHFCISDVVIKGEMTEELKRSAELYAGCVSGALNVDEYLGIVEQSGFKNSDVKKNKKIELPEDLLKRNLTAEGLDEYKKNLKGIFSITVVGYKE